MEDIIDECGSEQRWLAAGRGNLRRSISPNKQDNRRRYVSFRLWLLSIMLTFAKQNILKGPFRLVNGFSEKPRAGHTLTAD